MKKVLICTALAKFIKSFLENDILILQEKGYEVHVAANINHVGAEGMEKYFQNMNVIFHQVDFSSNKPFSKSTIIASKQFNDIIKKDYFDLVHIHTPVPGVICRFCCIKSRKKGTVVVYTTHGFYFHSKSSRKTWLIYHNIEKIMSRFCVAIITINREDYENAKKMHCENVYYIHGVGVDVKKFRDVQVDRDSYRKMLGIDINDILILAVGELSHRKNHRVIREAISKLNSCRLVFMICGNSLSEPETVNEIIELANKENVDLRLMGLRNDIPQICKCADIGVLPSLREGLGLAGIEMIASGLPVVASNVHGIVDYVKEGVNGFLADPNNPDEYAAKLKKLIDKNIRKKIAEKCSQTVDEFDKVVSNSEMNEVYNELL